MLTVFSWSVWNGANYYMDVFGKRFQKELEQVKRDVAKWQNSPAAMFSPPTGATDPDVNTSKGHGKRESIDKIPLLDETGQPQQDEIVHDDARSTGAEILNAANEGVLDRKNAQAPIATT